MCIYCQGGEHELCDSPANLESVADGLFLFTCCCKGNAGAFVETVGEPRPVGRPQKDGTDMVDVLSTGRHRAEKLLPNIKGAPCHWRGLLYAGGGVVPIVGCLKGTAEARHHGPDKSVLNNSVGVNLHAICTTCITKEMRLLTEDLRWVPAKDIRVGDRLIGFSEDLSLEGNQFEPAVVQSIEVLTKPAARITMKNGDVLVSSLDHQWVANRPSDRHTKWFTTRKFFSRRSKDHYALKKLLHPWDEEPDGDNWLAGFLDGEGCLSGYVLSVSQTDKATNDSTVDRMYFEMDKWSKPPLLS